MAFPKRTRAAILAFRGKKGVLKKAIRAQAKRQKLIHGHHRSYGACRAAAHSGRQREPLPKLEFDPLGYTHISQERGYRSARRVLGYIKGEPPTVSMNSPDPEFLSSNPGRLDGVARTFQSQAQNIEPAGQVPDGGRREGFTLVFLGQCRLPSSRVSLSRGPPFP